MDRLIKQYGFQLVHCHTPTAGAIARVACYKNHVRVIYTAHGFHFYTGAPKKNWMIFYPEEKVLSYVTDVLITINREDYRRAKKRLKAGKILYIPGVGVDTEKYKKGNGDPEDKRKELNLSGNDIMLLSVGELSARKNHEIVIRALGKINNLRLHYFIAGTGELKEAYTNLVKELNLDKNIHFLGYRTDISELCHAADLYIFPSVQEGLPVALMEAIASRTPVICSDIRGNVDLIRDRRYLFDPKCVDSVAQCIEDKVGFGQRDQISVVMQEEITSNYVRLSRYDLLAVKRKMNKVYKEGGGGTGTVELRQLIIRQELQIKFGIKKDDILLLSVGELNDNKNHELGIRAFYMLKGDEGFTNIHYLICGQGILKGYLEQLIKELGLESQVHLLGYREDIADIYGCADIFLFLSGREGLPVALMESMAAGVPSIVTKIRGNTDLIRDGREGYVVEKDEKEVEEALRKMLSGTRQAMGEEALKRIKRFDTDIIKKEMRKWYGE